MTLHVATHPLTSSRLVDLLRRVFVCPLGHRFIFHRDPSQGLVLVCPRCLSMRRVLLPSSEVHHA